MKRAERFLRCPLIGEEVALSEYNKRSVNRKATIIKESKYSIEVLQDGKKKTFLKKGLIFKFKGMNVQGENIIGDAIDRIKRFR